MTFKAWSRSWPTGQMVHDSAVVAEARETHDVHPQLTIRGAVKIVAYSRTRVYLDRDAWEMLPPDGVLLMQVRPTDGTGYSLALTATELEAVFGEVRSTRSWDEARCYHFAKPPPAAAAFRMPASRDGSPDRESDQRSEVDVSRSSGRGRVSSRSAGARDGKDIRWAKLANVLGEAARSNRVDPQDARTVLVHALRVRQTNAKLRIRPRSVGAQASIDKYAPESPPPNGSPDSLHADHTHSFPHTGPRLNEFFSRLTTVEAWLEELRQLDQVVCLTAAENEAVRPLEVELTGPEKYEQAGITFVDATPWDNPGATPTRTVPLAE